MINCDKQMTKKNGLIHFKLDKQRITGKQKTKK